MMLSLLSLEWRAECFFRILTHVEFWLSACGLAFR